MPKTQQTQTNPWSKIGVVIGIVITLMLAAVLATVVAMVLFAKPQSSQPTHHASTSLEAKGGHKGH